MKKAINSERSNVNDKFIIHRIEENYTIYYPYYNYITGNVNSSLLLRRIISLFELTKGKSFYKFRSRPSKKNPRYKLHDDWCEVMGFKPRMFDTALEKIMEYGNKYPKTPNRERETQEEFDKRMQYRKDMIKNYDLQPGETEEERELRIHENRYKYLRCCLRYKTNKKNNITVFYIDDLNFFMRFLKENINDKIDSENWDWQGFDFAMTTKTTKCDFPSSQKVVSENDKKQKLNTLKFNPLKFKNLRKKM